MAVNQIESTMKPVSNVVLAQVKSNNEVVSMTHRCRTFSAYRYVVGIVGGMYHGIETYCTTEESALFMFNLIVSALRGNARLAWLLAG